MKLKNLVESLKSMTEKAVAAVKKHPLLSFGLLVAALVLLGLTCQGCATSNDEQELPSTVDVSGVYVIKSGYQEFITPSGTEREEFTLSDGIALSVSQSGDAVQMFTCFGVMDKDLKVRCVDKVETEDWGQKCCRIDDGELQFTENGARLRLHMEGFCEGVSGSWSSEVELELLYDTHLCDFEVGNDGG
ncbi:MAG: hypothetical protein DRN26_00225 [Thermoplasmata archaeon]|nr:MAG: hypothetical protein DRN26_00225 [Thermoplasmata archaeon]